MINKTILTNGLQIITQQDLNAKTVTVSFTIKCGSYNENEGIYGIAHFTEHMLFKGTTKRTSQQISEAIEGIGGILNAETTFEYTRYYCTIPAENWQKGLDVLFDMILFNTIPEDEFEREKQVVLEELKMYDDEPDSKIFELLFQQLFKSYKNRQLVGGTIKSVAALNRNQMLEFIEKNYNFNNMIVMVTGNIDHEKLVESLESYAKDIDLNTVKSESAKDSFIPDKLGQKDVIEKKDIAQSHLCWGLFGPPPTDKEYLAGEIIATILGGNSSSRLYQIIREQKGLAYTVSMDIDAMSDTSIFTGYVGLDGNNIKAVKKVVNDELTKLKTTLLTEDELQRAKAYIKGTTLISQETTSGKIRFINNSVLIGLDLEIEKFLEDIETVTIYDIQNFANKYFKPDNICFTQIIPK
jgi:predicted Zn-dependent peptidase